MEDLEQFKKRINSLMNKVLDGNVVLLKFLDETEQCIIEELANKNHINAYFFGGFINAEYQRCILSIYEVSNDDFDISVYKINYPKKFIQISHRSILGSLMSLGIKREMIGDIFIDSDNNAYFACCNTLADFLKENFNKIGHSYITIDLYPELITLEKNYLESTEFVSSLRIDVILSAGFNLSRAIAHDEIINGNVKINHLISLNPAYLVKENDCISLTHHGRIILKEIKGKSRSDKFVITLQKTKNK